MDPELVEHLTGVSLGFAVGLTAFFTSFAGMSVLRIFQDAANN
jgi:hypothetical protein